MNKRYVFMFSGQGSQYYQMGKELYEKHEHFRYWMNHCDGIVSPLIQASLIDVLYKEKRKSDPFDDILYTNPALLCIGYSMFKVLEEMDVRPDCLLGYSLGEIIASLVSGVISLEDGIQLVVDIARLVVERTQQAKMLAILESKTIILEFPELFHQCWITGTNFQNNFVVGGMPLVIEQLQTSLNKKNITSQLLPVRFGFHTKLIDPIEEECRRLIREIRLLPGRIPIISSLTTEVTPAFNEEHFWEVIRYPVNFEQAVHNMLKNGDYTFIDLGPSGSLAACVKHILPCKSKSNSVPVINQFGQDLHAIEKLKISLG